MPPFEAQRHRYTPEHFGVQWRIKQAWPCPHVAHGSVGKGRIGFKYCLFHGSTFATLKYLKQGKTGWCSGKRSTIHLKLLLKNDVLYDSISLSGSLEQCLY